MKVAVQLTVDTRLIADLKVFYAKAMQGSEQIACEHPLTMELLRGLPKQIECAASYVLALGGKEP